jgi:hypothetical protein
VLYLFSLSLHLLPARTRQQLLPSLSHSHANWKKKEETVEWW